MTMNKTKYTTNTEESFARELLYDSAIYKDGYDVFGKNYKTGDIYSNIQFDNKILSGTVSNLFYLFSLLEQKELKIAMSEPCPDGSVSMYMEIEKEGKAPYKCLIHYVAELNEVEICQPKTSSDGSSNHWARARRGLLIFLFTYYMQNYLTFNNDEFRKIYEYKVENNLYFLDDLFYEDLKNYPLSKCEYYLSSEDNDIFEGKADIFLHKTNTTCPFDKMFDADFGIVPETVKGEETKAENFKQDILDGKYLLGEEFSDLVPALCEINDFIISEDFQHIVKRAYQRIMKALASNKSIGNNFLLAGGAGTGKSTIARMLACALGLPLYIQQISANTEESDFYGNTIVEKGKFTMTDTNFIKAFRDGGVIILEEVNLARTEIITGVLSQALEKPYTIHDYAGNTIHRHPKCIIIGCQNVGYEGTRNQNLSFITKMGFLKNITSPDKDQFVDIILAGAESEQRDVAESFYDVYFDVRNVLRQPSVAGDDLLDLISIRSCINAVSDFDCGMSQSELIDTYFLAPLYAVDPQIYDEVVNTVRPRIRRNVLYTSFTK